MFDFNQLTWFLYFADVLVNLSGFLTVLCGILFVVGGAGLLVWKILTSDHSSVPDQVKEINDKLKGLDGKSQIYRHEIPKLEVTPLPPKSLVTLWTIASIVFLISMLVPSESTMYRMAASEAGEMVVKDEYTQEILDDLKDVIKYQLKSLKGE